MIIFLYFVNIVVVTSFILISFAIYNNFINANNTKVKYKKNSIVETGTMYLFFLFYYLSIRFQIGFLPNLSNDIRLSIMIIGLILIILGTTVNLLGRLKLGKNWANQILIYKDHYLVKQGVYKIVRHPLYASLIWIFLGGSLIYANYLSFLLNLFIFIPFMYYRAKQEETVLLKQYPEYKKYRQQVAMFCPKILLWHQK